MPAKDVYHDRVRAALIRDGWAITHDPYTIPIGLDRSEEKKNEGLKVERRTKVQYR